MVVKKSSKKIETELDSDLSHILKESQSILGAGSSILAAVEVIVDIDGEIDPELEDELLATAILEPGEDLSVLEAPDYVEINDTLFTVLDGARAEYLSLTEAVGEGELSVLDDHAVGVAKRRLDDAVSAIVEANKGLVRIYVRRFLKQTNPENRADYEASGTLGLIKAIDSYDRDKGRFSSWAWRPIVRETLRAVRAAEYAYVNTGDFEKRPDILRAREALRGDNLDYEPSYKEISTLAKVTTRQVERVLRAREHESLSKPIGAESDMTLGEVIEDVEVNVEEQVIYGMGLDALDQYGLQSLEPRELFVLTRRFGLDGEPEQKLSKLGQVLNLSREAVRQIEGRALAKLHPYFVRLQERVGPSPVVVPLSPLDPTRGLNFFLSALTVAKVRDKTGETAQGGSQHITAETIEIDFFANESTIENMIKQPPGEIEISLTNESDNDVLAEESDLEPPSRWKANAALRYEYLELATIASTAQAEGDQLTLDEVTRKQQAIMNSFCDENKGLALKVARKFKRVQGGNEDYEQDAFEGMVVAFHRWDPARSTFGTFCQSYILGKVNRGFNNLEYGDRSYGDHTAAPHVLSAKNELTELLGRRPTSLEMAEKAGVTIGVVDRVLAGRALRLDAPIGEDGKTLGDDIASTLSDDGESFSDADPDLVDNLLKLLPPRELWTIINRDGLGGAEPMTLAGIASEMAGGGRESLRRDDLKARATMLSHLKMAHLPLK